MIAEFMESPSQPLSNEDLLALEEQRQQDVPEEVSITEPRGLTHSLTQGGEPFL
jgi:hypothetical protein